MASYGVEPSERSPVREHCTPACFKMHGIMPCHSPYMVEDVRIELTLPPYQSGILTVEIILINGGLREL